MACCSQELGLEKDAATTVPAAAAGAESGGTSGGGTGELESSLNVH